MLPIRQHCRRERVRGICTYMCNVQQRRANHRVGFRRCQRARAISARGSRKQVFMCERDASALSPRTFKLLCTRHCVRNKVFRAIDKLNLRIAHNRAQLQRVAFAIFFVVRPQRYCITIRRMKYSRCSRRTAILCSTHSNDARIAIFNE